MKVVYKNDAGIKEFIPYEIEENRLTLNEELTIALDKYERDDPAHYDVCFDKFGCLVMGVIPGVAERYVAQIDIPAREYDYIADGEDDDGNPQEVPMPVPFDPENATLTLWGTEQKIEQYAVTTASANGDDSSTEENPAEDSGL